MSDFKTPQSRNEALLQNVLGAHHDLGAPQSRNEKFLMTIAGATGITLPEPESRIEALLKEICENGTGGGEPAVIEELEVTENGIYEAPEGVDGYSPITVNVPSGQVDRRVKHLLERQDLYTQGITLDLSNCEAERIGGYAMAYWPFLGTVILPSTITMIGQYAFNGNTRMEIDALPDSLQRIESYAFQNCATLNFAGLNHVTYVAERAFNQCTNLRLSELPNHNLQLGIGAFAASGVKIKEIPGGCTLGTQTFAECGSITQLDIKWDGSTARNYNNGVFKNCTGLETLKVRRNIGNTFFRECTNLQHVWISADVTDINAAVEQYSPFRGCNALTDIYCEAAERPANWGTGWNYTDTTTQATVHWGVSEAEFDSMI